MMPIILFFALTLFPSLASAACTGSSPTWTTTVDQSSFSTCVTSASNGDTLNVSAGSDTTWASAVTIPSGKTLHIVGAGTGSTTIGAATNIAILAIESDDTTITALTVSCGMLRIGGFAQDVRIHHNAFTCGTNAFGVESLSSGNGPDTPRGLIDNNTFTGTKVLSAPHRKTSVVSLQGSNHWTLGAQHGTAEGLIIEDNTFSKAGIGGNAVDCNYAGRYTFRYNTVTDSYIEGHAVQGANRACRGGEAYYNTVNDATEGSFYMIYLRGGSWRIFNNTFTGGFGAGKFRLDSRRGCEAVTVSGKADGTSTWDQNTAPTATYRGWLVRDQIGAGADDAAWGVSDSDPPTQGRDPLYAWLNTDGGADLPPNVTTSTAGCDGGTNYSPEHIVINRDYYTYTASFDGTTGVGTGTLASRPATCTTGVGYWATDQGSWNKKYPGQQGVLYTCTATDTWTLSYTPYQYPHPLQTEFYTRKRVPPGLFKRSEGPMPFGRFVSYP